MENPKGPKKPHVSVAEEDTKTSRKNSLVQAGSFSEVLFIQPIPITRYRRLLVCEEESLMYLCQLITEQNTAEAIALLGRNYVALGAKLGVDELTPVHIAVSYGNLELCAALLDYSAATDLNAADRTGKTPLHYACLLGKEPVVRLLVRSGADLNRADQNRDTPLHLAAGHSDIYRWLVQRGADQRALNNQGLTPWRMSPEACLADKVDFQVIKTLGRGRNGRVCLVQSKGQLLVAKSYIRASDSNLVRHALIEKKLLKRHNFIAEVRRVFQTEKLTGLFVEFCPAGDLAAHLARSGRFPEQLARTYLSEVVLALEYIHSLGLLHRNLRADNVLLDGEGHVKLSNLGASQAESPLEYTPPEVIRGEGYSTASDWYLCGVLLYEMCVGRPPFYSRSEAELRREVLGKRVKLLGNMSAPLRSLLKRVRFRQLLDKDPQSRAMSARAIKGQSFFKGVDWDRVSARGAEVSLIRVMEQTSDEKRACSLEAVLLI